jgi:hypothetical protein
VTAQLPIDPWWADADLVHAVATWAVDTSEITDTNELLYFFEKPYKYPELFTGWEGSQD